MHLWRHVLPLHNLLLHHQEMYVSVRLRLRHVPNLWSKLVLYNLLVSFQRIEARRLLRILSLELLYSLLALYDALRYSTELLIRANVHHVSLSTFSCGTIAPPPDARAPGALDERGESAPAVSRQLSCA